MKVFMNNLTCVVIVLLLIPSITWAGWSGSIALIETTLGDGPEQIPLWRTDMGESVPESFYILPDNTVAISESVIKIFGSKGIVRSFSWKPVPRFRGTIHYSDIGIYVSGGVKPGDPANGIYLYDFQGELIRKIEKKKLMGVFKIVLTTGEFITRSGGKYYKYSPEGQLIATYESDPREMESGIERSTLSQIDGSRVTVVEYKDAVFSINSPEGEEFEHFSRDKQGNLITYIRLGDVNKMYSRVYKFDHCGKVLGTFDLPPNNTYYGPKPGYSYEQLIHEAYYTEPQFTENGDIITLFRNETEYKILKWIWVDDLNDPKGGPDAPVSLKVLPSISGIYLTWETALQDPGCVSGYEVERATTSGGIFSKVADVGTGVFKYHDETAAVGTTYYYRVRAMSAIGASDYTAEGSAKR